MSIESTTIMPYSQQDNHDAESHTNHHQATTFANTKSINTTSRSGNLHPTDRSNRKKALDGSHCNNLNYHQYRSNKNSGRHTYSEAAHHFYSTTTNHNTNNVNSANINTNNYAPHYNSSHDYALKNGWNHQSRSNNPSKHPAKRNFVNGADAFHQQTSYTSLDTSQQQHMPRIPPYYNSNDEQDEVELVLNMNISDVPIHPNPNPIPNPTDLDPEELRVALQKQLEYYFSRQNLAQDSFLVSQMNSELYVPISVVANFNIVKAMTADIDLIIDVLRSSKEVTVDSTGTKVKPNISVPRTTIILRDIPADATTEEIKGIFIGESGRTPISVKPDIGNTWYVTFENEDDALQMLFYIRGKYFKSVPIAGRLKSENILKSFYNPDSNPEGYSIPNSNNTTAPSQALPVPAVYGYYPTPMYNPITQFPPAQNEWIQHRQYAPPTNGYSPTYYDNPQDGAYMYPQQKQNESESYRGKFSNGQRARPLKDNRKASGYRGNDGEFRSNGQITRRNGEAENRRSSKRSGNQRRGGDKSGGRHDRRDYRIGEGYVDTARLRQGEDVEKDSEPRVRNGAPAPQLELENFPPLPTTNTGNLAKDKLNPYASIAIADIVKGLKPGEKFAPPKKSISLDHYSNGDSQQRSLVVETGKVISDNLFIPRAKSTTGANLLQYGKHDGQSIDKQISAKDLSKAAPAAKESGNGWKPSEQLVGLAPSEKGLPTASFSYAAILMQKKENPTTEASAQSIHNNSTENKMDTPCRDSLVRNPHQ